MSKESSRRGFLNFLLPRIISKRKIQKIYFDDTEKELLSFTHQGYLKQVGWLEAFKTRKPVDENNRPIPWVTYSFIDFITERLTKDISLFEYGSGYSTLFYAQRVRQVTSVEHDKEWYDQMKSTIPSNAELIFKELVYGGEYSQTPVKGKVKYDIIIVDGRDRANCCIRSFEALTPNGVIVLDDSERSEYKAGTDFLIEKGFKRIDFWGISPGLFYKKATSVFYRPDNTLHI
jgi:hypothetical protein